MTDKDILISDLNDISEILNNNGYGGWCATIRKAVALLKEQEEAIPVSWLTEKLEGHPELPYAVTDGINNVLELWERSVKLE